MAPGALATLVLLVGGVPSAQASTNGITTPLPRGSSRTAHSFRPWTSADGRFVAFDSDSTTLVPGDTNRARDIFIHDRAMGQTSRVNLGVGGVEADDDSQRPTLSSDGRYIVFWSGATNLVSDDTNGVADAFVVDRVDGNIRRVSVGHNGVEADGASLRPVISADGKFVAFESEATNLLTPGLVGRSTDTNGQRDIFVHELDTRTTTRVSVTADGAEGRGPSLRPSISGDGRFVAFHSSARLDPADKDETRDVYLHDRATAFTYRLSVSKATADSDQEGAGGSFSPAISADGRYVTYWSNAPDLVAGDTNGAADIFVIDRETARTERVSTASDGTEGDDDSSDPAISPDGRFVAFWSQATNLVDQDRNGMRDVFLHDREAHTTIRVSVASDGTEGDADSFSPNANAGGGLVVFDSEATTLVAGDNNRGSDIFLHTS